MILQLIDCEDELDSIEVLALVAPLQDSNGVLAFRICVSSVDVVFYVSQYGSVSPQVHCYFRILLLLLIVVVCAHAHDD